MQSKSTLLAEAATKSRPSTTPETRRAHVDKWKQSGLSMSEYCRRQGLAISSVSAWAQQINRSQSTFKPVTVRSAVSDSYSAVNELVIELQVDDKIKIKFMNVTDSKLIAALIKDISRCS